MENKKFLLIFYKIEKENKLWYNLKINLNKNNLINNEEKERKFNEFSSV